MTTKAPKDYSQGKVYKIEPTCDHEEGEIYIGSTTKKYLSQRFVKHRYDYKYWREGKQQKKLTSFILFEKYGVENCIITLLESVGALSYDELLSREAHYIKTLKCVNYITPLQTLAEYYVANKERLDENRRKYYKENKEFIIIRTNQYKTDNKEKLQQHKKQYIKVNEEKIIKQRQKYYENNKEIMIKKDNEYYHTNKEKISERHKKYYEANKEKILEQQRQHRAKLRSDSDEEKK